MLMVDLHLRQIWRANICGTQPVDNAARRQTQNRMCEGKRGVMHLVLSL
jgi:hypothetical protein